MLKRTLYNCDCSDIRHSFIVSEWTDEVNDDHRTLSLEIQLSIEPFWKRVIIAIQYIFGYTSRFGHWAGPEIDIEEAKRLQNHLKNFIKD